MGQQKPLSQLAIPNCPTVDEFLSPMGIARQPFQRLEQPL